MRNAIAVLACTFAAVLASASAPETTDTSAGLAFNYCQITTPGMRDNSGRYCDNAYGVTHGGYIVDDTCYYDANAAYNAMNTIYACNFPAPIFVGNCRLAYPSERGIDGHYCNNSYGVFFQGSILNNTCYHDMDATLRNMQNSPVCTGMNQSYGYCNMVGPGQRDRAGRYCANAYGFQYDGYIVDNTCYPDPNRAYTAMINEYVCNNPPPLAFGRCYVFNPGVRDNQGRYCDNAYGIGYIGQILNNTCYKQLRGVLSAMQNSPICRY
jgi:hypothetical protein